MHPTFLWLVVAASVLLAQGSAVAEDQLRIAVGARGVGETFVPELGEKAGFFKKHGLALEVLEDQLADGGADLRASDGRAEQGPRSSGRPLSLGV